jgi:hypothetical protein
MGKRCLLTSRAAIDIRRSQFMVVMGPGTGMGMDTVMVMVVMEMGIRESHLSILIHLAFLCQCELM